MIWFDFFNGISTPYEFFKAKNYNYSYFEN